MSSHPFKEASGSAGCGSQPHDKVSPSAKTPLGGKGRPKRNVLADAARILQEFQTCGDTSEAFFGTASKTTLQWVGRLYDAIVAQLVEAPPDDESTAELTIMKKRVSALLAIMKGVRKHAVESEGMNQIILEQLRFLSMEPVVLVRSSTTLFVTPGCPREHNNKPKEFLTV